jgi:hypothetical protein
MAYQVDKFNGNFLVSVEDGTIDTTTDLRFVGKNYAGYGEVQNENFLHLLESFANTTAPPKSITGQIWYDSTSTTKKLKYYDGTRWKVAGGAEVAATAPSGLSVGDFWWDTSAQQLYAWSGTEFTLVGPESSPNLGSSTISASVVKGTVDTAVGPHTILKVFADDKVIGVFSKTAFTLDGSQNPIEDFTVIKKGLTLTKSQSGVSTDDYKFWGTAENTNRLGGILASQYLKRGDFTFEEEVRFLDPGFSLGGSSVNDAADIRLYVENDEVIFENRLGNDITFRITVNQATDERDIAVIRATGIVPGRDSEYSLGAESSKWSNVYATTFRGNVVGNVTGNTTGNHTGNVASVDGQVMINATTKQIGYTGAVIIGTLTGSVTGSAASATNSSRLNDLSPSITVPGGGVASIPVRDTSGNITATQFIGVASNTEKTRINNSATDPTWNGVDVATQYRSATTTQSAWTIAARDANADLTARKFIGTATSAEYADLAEKYLADKEYDVGTVVAIGGDAEVTACKFSDRAIGVVSANPAYMMNSELEGGTYIALKGRVPVKVIGSIRKGDRLVAADNGCGIHASFHQHPDIFAVALESSDDTGIKLIEALVL